MNAIAVHAACAALVAADLAARTLRLHALARGAGNRITARASLGINLLADAGATLTPMRLGGEPARIAGMRAAGMRFGAIGVAIAYELIVAWPTLAVVAVALAIGLAPRWLDSVGPNLARKAATMMPWLLLTLAAALLVVLVARRRRSGSPRRGWRRSIRIARRAWRRMPHGPVLLAVPCSLVNVLARTALLPTLAQVLPDPPSTAALWLGSFVLVYGQLVFPTPAGAGAVDLGLLAGAAGEFGGAETGMLLAWRWWSSGASAVGGLLVAAALLAGGRRFRFPAAAHSSRFPAASGPGP
jgi:uncharacterized membrane protein YbhN (UPF0104 family)